MILDREMTFSDAQALTSGADVKSTDKFDSGDHGVNINTNREMQVFCSVVTAFAGGTNITVNLVESDNSDLSSPDVLATSGAVVTASLTAGAELLRTALPRTNKRYLGFQYVISGTYTAGAVTGGIVRDTHDTDIPSFHTGY